MPEFFKNSSAASCIEEYDAFSAWGRIFLDQLEMILLFGAKTMPFVVLFGAKMMPFVKDIVGPVGIMTIL